MSLSEYLASLDLFRRDRYHALEPVPAVLDWFRDEGSRCRHVALSAVPRPFADLTAAWVLKHFGSWITTFAFVPVRTDGLSLNGRSAESKRDYLAWLGKGDVLVEDRAETLAAARTLGLRGVLIPQPWNAARLTTLDDAMRELSNHLSREAHERSHR